MVFFVTGNLRKKQQLFLDITTFSGSAINIIKPKSTKKMLFIPCKYYLYRQNYIKCSVVYRIELG